MLLFLSSGLLSAQSAQLCSRLTNLRLHDARMTLAELHESGSFTPLRKAAIAGLPPFCRVAIEATPTTDSHIRIEVWMPLAGWNERLLAEGSGGFAGEIGYEQLGSGAREGFATVTTDMGTSPATPTNADALVGHPERWIDWGYRATHLMTLLSKEVVRAFYGRAATYAYFRGCSTGGEQGLAEAQRFPEDYDGILSGAPANKRTRLHEAILWNYGALRRGVQAGLTPARMQLVSNAVLRSCTTRTGLMGSPEIIDPERCAFDPGTLLCKEDTRDNMRNSCLTEGEIRAVEQVYAGPKDRQGQSLYPGLSKGSEGEWSLPSAGQGNGEVPFGSIFRWVWGPGWDWRSFDFNRDAATVDQRLAPLLNATSPDLKAFQRQSHKLLLYHGWADPLIAPEGSVRYFEDVLRVSKTASGLSAEKATRGMTQDSIRLYMIPGMAHCGGGTGPVDLDLLPALQDWVEGGTAPNAIPLERTGKDGVTRAEVLCPYPQAAEASYSSGIPACRDQGTATHKGAK